MITPQQLAELRSTKRIAGRIGSDVLYWVDIQVDIFERVVELTSMGVAVPTWYDLSLHKVAERRIIATTSPEWFITLEETTRYAQAAAE